ncbi:MAG: nucleoside triphosphate pyrophosphohydrolase [Clostridia bacterium]|nr:nucleoside triphosphate pyrophosphohydrolase [Clostridia bacterium]
MERVYNKLVRDKIPEIIKSKGERPIVKELYFSEYKLALEKKLNEECQEVIGASGTERVEEIADVLEVLRALAKLEGFSLKQVISVADEKNAKRGAFEKRIFLEKVISDK